MVKSAYDLIQNNYLLALFKCNFSCHIRIEKRLRTTISYDTTTDTPEVKAPMFLLNIYPEAGETRPRTFIFTIHQDDTRRIGSPPFIDFGARHFYWNLSTSLLQLTNSCI